MFLQTKNLLFGLFNNFYKIIGLILNINTAQVNIEYL
jgi:hypothetical protein